MNFDVEDKINIFCFFCLHCIYIFSLKYSFEMQYIQRKGIIWLEVQLRPINALLLGTGKKLLLFDTVSDFRSY